MSPLQGLRLIFQSSQPRHGRGWADLFPALWASSPEISIPAAPEPGALQNLKLSSFIPL